MAEVFAHRSPIDIAGSFMKSAPVDLDGLAEELGLFVHEMDGWDDRISGSIQRVGRSYLIKLNSRNAPGRKRFTLAHEIAHYILHRDLIGDGITDDILYRSNQPGYIETEANQYAAGLLMPAPLILKHWEQGVQSPREMADNFDVSVRAAEIRMRELLVQPCTANS